MPIHHLASVRPHNTNTERNAGVPFLNFNIISSLPPLYFTARTISRKSYFSNGSEALIALQRAVPGRAAMDRWTAAGPMLQLRTVPDLPSCWRSDFRASAKTIFKFMGIEIPGRARSFGHDPKRRSLWAFLSYSGRFWTIFGPFFGEGKQPSWNL